MTVGDLENLEKSPPKIATKRKHYRVVNNKAMQQFGADAFSLDLQMTDRERRDEIERRINNWSQMDSLLSPANRFSEIQ